MSFRDVSFFPPTLKNIQTDTRFNSLARSLLALPLPPVHEMDLPMDLHLELSLSPEEKSWDRVII